MSHAAAWASGAKTWARRVPRVAPMSGMRARRWRAISRTAVVSSTFLQDNIKAKTILVTSPARVVHDGASPRSPGLRARVDECSEHLRDAGGPVRRSAPVLGPAAAASRRVSASDTSCTQTSCAESQYHPATADPVGVWTRPSSTS
eukprot:scaffold19191_cov134-Isochrysis_galbana.AAC.2